MVYEEVHLCSERENRSIATEATILQAAISTAVAAFGKDGGKAASKQFSKMIKSLSGDESPASRPMPRNVDRGAD